MSDNLCSDDAIFFEDLLIMAQEGVPGELLLRKIERAISRHGDQRHLLDNLFHTLSVVQGDVRRAHTADHGLDHFAPGQGRYVGPLRRVIEAFEGRLGGG